jgi:hypothetical protein
LIDDVGGLAGDGGRNGLAFFCSGISASFGGDDGADDAGAVERKLSIAICCAGGLALWCFDFGFGVLACDAGAFVLVCSGWPWCATCDEEVGAFDFREADGSTRSAGVSTR